jgi:hypothetical protein
MCAYCIVIPRLSSRVFVCAIAVYAFLGLYPGRALRTTNLTPLRNVVLVSPVLIVLAALPPVHILYAPYGSRLQQLLGWFAREQKYSVVLFAAALTAMAATAFALVLGIMRLVHRPNTAHAAVVGIGAIFLLFVPFHPASFSVMLICGVAGYVLAGIAPWSLDGRRSLALLAVSLFAFFVTNNIVHHLLALNASMVSPGLEYYAMHYGVTAIPLGYAIGTLFYIPPDFSTLSTDAATGGTRPRTAPGSSALAGYQNASQYTVPVADFKATVYTRLAIVGDIAFKMPTQAWLEDFDAAMNPPREARTTKVRLATPLEKSVDDLLRRYPGYESLCRTHERCAHFLMVHHLQHDLLMTCTELAIPESRFVHLEERVENDSTNVVPGVVQERVGGVTLLDMLDDPTSPSPSIRDEFIPYLPVIQDRLGKVLRSEFRDKLNWYIRNFVLSPDGRLWYVDAKPSCIFGSSSNEANIAGLRVVFGI